MEKTLPSPSVIKYLIRGVILVGVACNLRLISYGCTSHADEYQHFQDFELAKRESLNFFNDIPSDQWKLLKDRVKWQSPNYNTLSMPVYDETTGEVKKEVKMNSRVFYENHFEPEFACMHERRIGQMGDGGKWICDPYRIIQKKNNSNNMMGGEGEDGCLVYSIGSNNDFSFENFVYSEISQDCEIHTFDPGNYSKGAEKAGVNYHQYYVGLDEGESSKSMKTIVEELGHQGRTIDIFKIDCEGCEWVTAEHWFDAPVFIRQIQVEVHNVKMRATPKFFDDMWHNHYVITHKEPNILSPRGCVEYAFLKLSPDFFEGIDRPNASMPDSFFEKFPHLKLNA
eukprot:CAMPEP_0185725932 /NCGR_PEP_ID=MMETSP1171-20130828/2057_1 /TAXON_ID=374046 /ORGANISM="Helicotheca tamensis, Strain CCMP826" /LENGTH=339 /DNA_ID=CAMNT_0028394177 /DNA_START=167 /DNA_END=1186 /DNA_ORIENTATION=-